MYCCAECWNALIISISLLHICWALEIESSCRLKAASSCSADIESQFPELKGEDVCRCSLMHETQHALGTSALGSYNFCVVDEADLSDNSSEDEVISRLDV